ncbi:hypothetical protein WICMUC_003299 [Wickerhamomyces mucosus]|uniref:Riboflavin synthase n=1 Tax=Wickerhamomyces mucosus TaxID=1378264 RepID=A0A9P8PLY8_9ASCO|nr:hypothetical protein WICMUC_003299 [Wickerhamomyces mucosus]
MFTGIVEHVGNVSSILFTNNNIDEGATIIVGEASKILTDVHIGDSISVNGTCLTVTEFSTDSFTVELIPETLDRTNLGKLTIGSKVNLERAVGGDVRFGGHYVQGHVDTVASIVSKTPQGDALNFIFQIKDKSYLNYIVEKGFITIDGVSLTVTFVDYDKAQFGISMIKHTQAVVILPFKADGEEVNIEVDLTGKLIEKQVELYLTNGLENNDKFVNLIESIVEKKLKQLSK